jgi:hypothetical protein
VGGVADGAGCRASCNAGGGTLAFGRLRCVLVALARRQDFAHFAGRSEHRDGCGYAMTLSRKFSAHLGGPECRCALAPDAVEGSRLSARENVATFPKMEWRRWGRR